jgi:UDP-N-acetyl-D-galactosamine dehydrogenase
VAQRRKIAVIGLGYVGLPVAVSFAQACYPVVGFDIDARRIAELRAGHDRTREVEPADLALASLSLTSEPESLTAADFFIVTVPTPIDPANRPDLRALFGASETVGKALQKGGIVVYESTVYPGCVEEDCVPVLERASGLRAGSDFTVGYSPERINPGDKTHRFETIVKVVAGQDAKTLDVVADVYGAQRDLNIAFMNELSAICHRLGIDTGDVLAAAGTKWNFQKFYPGLVGGHCIGVDPYYLTYRAERAGYHPEVILAGRRINDGVGQRVALTCIQALFKRQRINATVTVLGITFKENVPDTRNSKVADIVRELSASGVRVQVHDPLASAQEAKHEYGIDLLDRDALKPGDAVVLAVSHDEYTRGGWPLICSLLRDGEGLVFDVKSMLDRASKPGGIELWRL